MDEKKVIPAPAGEKAGALVPLNDKELLEANLRNQSVAELEAQMKKEQKPIQVKRKTLSDQLRKDSTAMSLLRLANASYDRELNKYNVSFQQATMA